MSSTPPLGGIIRLRNFHGANLFADGGPRRRQTGGLNRPAGYLTHENLDYSLIDGAGGGRWALLKGGAKVLSERRGSMF